MSSPEESSPELPEFVLSVLVQPRRGQCSSTERLWGRIALQCYRPSLRKIGLPLLEAGGINSGSSGGSHLIADSLPVSSSEDGHVPSHCENSSVHVRRRRPEHVEEQLRLGRGDAAKSQGTATDQAPPRALQSGQKQTSTPPFRTTRWILGCMWGTN